MHHKKPLKFYVLLLLISMASVGTVCISPSFPSLQRYFNTTQGEIQLLVSWFLLGYALGLLPFGPLCKRFGQKKTTSIVFMFAALFAALCFVAMWVKSLVFLIITRALLGFAMSIGLKSSFYYVGAYYQGREMTKRASYLTISFAIAPSMSIFVSGFLTDWFGWVGAFSFQLFYCFFGLYLATQLPADEEERDLLNFKLIFLKFGSCIRNLQVVISGAFMGVATSLVYVFAAESPFIAMNEIDISPGSFGFHNFLTSLGGLSGGLVGSYLAHHFQRRSLFFLSSVVMFLGSLGMLISFLTGYVTLFTLFGFMFVILFGVSIFTSNSASNALKEKLDKSYISSTINFINMFIAVVFVELLAKIRPGSDIVMPVMFVLLMAVAWLTLFLVPNFASEN